MSNRQDWNSKTGGDLKQRNVIAVLSADLRTPMPESMGGLGLWALLQAGVPMDQSHPQNTSNDWVLPINNCLSEQMERETWVPCLALIQPYIPPGCSFKIQQ